MSIVYCCDHIAHGGWALVTIAMPAVDWANALTVSTNIETHKI